MCDGQAAGVFCISAKLQVPAASTAASQPVPGIGLINLTRPTFSAPTHRTGAVERQLRQNIGKLPVAYRTEPDGRCVLDLWLRM